MRFTVLMRWCVPAIFAACSTKEPLPHETAGTVVSPAPTDVSVIDAPPPAASPRASGTLPRNDTAPAHGEPASKVVLHLQLLGEELSSEVMDDLGFVKKSIEAFYRLEVNILPPRALPEAAWYAPRKRYRAERLLDFLEAVRPSADDRILGITDRDISTTKGRHEDWGILGLATLDGSVCVVSSYRTRKKLSNAPDRKLRARVRFAKTVVHELGHNFNLEHCPNRGCLMEDAMGTVKTTDREYTFCDACRRKLRLGFPEIAVETPTPPWPEPESESE